MQYIILIIKGFFIGIAKIIPGVSGAMLAISMGIYEKAMKAISYFFDDAITNFKFLFSLGIGAILAVILTSNIILYFLTNYYLPTILLFIGLICGGIPMLFKKIDIKKLKKIDYFIFLFSFLFVFFLSSIGSQNIFVNLDHSVVRFFLYFLIGFIDCVTMIIPGISGTAVMMLLGCYDLLLNLLGSLGSFSQIVENITLLIPFISGIIITIILLSRLMTYLFEYKQSKAYCGIIGFSLSSIVILLKNIFNNTYTTSQIFVSILLFILGFYISFQLEKKDE